MRCLQCGRALPLWRRLRNEQFCSDEHRAQYFERLDSLALARLLEARQQHQRSKPAQRPRLRLAGPLAAPPPAPVDEKRAYLPAARARWIPARWALPTGNYQKGPPGARQLAPAQPVLGECHPVAPSLASGEPKPLEGAAPRVFVPHLAVLFPRAAAVLLPKIRACSKVCLVLDARPTRVSSPAVVTAAPLPCWWKCQPVLALSPIRCSLGFGLALAQRGSFPDGANLPARGLWSGPLPKWEPAQPGLGQRPAWLLRGPALASLFASSIPQPVKTGWLAAMQGRWEVAGSVPPVIPPVWILPLWTPQAALQRIAAPCLPQPLNRARQAVGTGQLAWISCASPVVPPTSVQRLVALVGRTGSLPLLLAPHEKHFIPQAGPIAWAGSQPRLRPSPLARSQPMGLFLARSLPARVTPAARRALIAWVASLEQFAAAQPQLVSIGGRPLCRFLLERVPALTQMTQPANRRLESRSLIQPPLPLPPRHFLCETQILSQSRLLPFSHCRRNLTVFGGPLRSRISEPTQPAGTNPRTCAWAMTPKPPRLPHWHSELADLRSRLTYGGRWSPVLSRAQMACAWLQQRPLRSVLLVTLAGTLGLASWIARDLDRWTASGDSPQILEQLHARVRQRAAIHWAEDFSGGLAAWTGGPGWHQSWSYDTAGLVLPGHLALWKPTLELRDYTVELVGFLETGGIGCAVRARDVRNYCGIRLELTSGGILASARVLAFVVQQGLRHELGDQALTFPLARNRMHQLTIGVEGPKLTTWVDGTLVAAFEQTVHASGGVGLFARPGDRVRVARLELHHQDDWLGKICAALNSLWPPADGREKSKSDRSQSRANP